MQSDEFEKSQFAARLQQVLDQRRVPEADVQLCELADADEDAATILKAAEFIASPPALVMYPSANFADRILAKIHAEDALELKQRQAPIWRRKEGIYWGLGFAAAVSLVVGMGLWNSEGNSDLVAKSSVEPKVITPTELAPTKPRTEPLDSDQARKALVDKLAVSEQKFEELKDVINPFRSTLNATIHVLRSTVPTRTPQPQQQAPIEGKPSTSLIHAKWIV